MSFKVGTDLTSLPEVDPRVVEVLRDSYGITTAEELVEALSFSETMEQDLGVAVGDLYLVTCTIQVVKSALGENHVRDLQTAQAALSTGAFKP